MRVRYQLAGSGEVAVCDLSDKDAIKLYADMKRNGECMWGELVGEDDDNYMDVIESFERIKEAQRLDQMLKSIVKSLF